MNILRRLPLSRLLALCGAVLAIGVSLTALALAVGAGPTPPPRPLAVAIHDALSGARPKGFSASIKLTDTLLEGANLASGGNGGGGAAGGSGGELTSNPLLAGGEGRLWVSADGRVRLELQSEKGDTQILYDGTTAELYDASTNTLYRYTPKSQSAGWTGYAPLKSAGHPPGGAGGGAQEPPSVAKLEEAIARASKHALLSGATPTDVGGQAAYTVRVSPRETGSLIGGAELSFDAGNGTPLRAAIYSSQSSSPVIELAAGEVSYEPVGNSVFEFAPPSNAKLVEVKAPEAPRAARRTKGKSAHGADLSATSHGHGLSSIWVLEEKHAGKGTSKSLEGLPKVQINGVSASELRTALGTVLAFQRSGVSYVLAGALPPQGLEALARGL